MLVQVAAVQGMKTEVQVGLAVDYAKGPGIQVVRKAVGCQATSMMAMLFGTLDRKHDH